MKDEEARLVATQKTVEVAEKKVHKVNAKLNLAESDKKSAEAALKVAKRQAEGGCSQQEEFVALLTTPFPNIVSFVNLDVDGLYFLRCSTSTMPSMAS